MIGDFPEYDESVPDGPLPVEYVDRHLYNEAGERVVAKLMDDRLLVSRSYPPGVQRRAIDEAFSLSAHR